MCIVCGKTQRFPLKPREEVEHWHKVTLRVELYQSLSYEVLHLGKHHLHINV